MRGGLTADEDVLKAYDGPVPAHVAAIMDGNGRWATSRGMQRIRGHHEGAESVRVVVECCRYLGVKSLTLYAFSSQNWGRPDDEVGGLMTLFDLYIKKERERLIANNVQLKLVGDRDRLSDKLQAAIAKLEADTSHNAEMLLQVAVSYGGREEIVQAARRIAAAVAAGEIAPDDVDETLLSSFMLTQPGTDPELVIRTSGEFRVSNFLLWQIAYAEFFVTPTLWPDFREPDLLEAFRAFGKRERRFGKTSAQLEGT